METYSVHINQRSIGIGLIEIFNFDIDDDREQLVVSELLPNSKGYELGLAIGDTLIAINGKSVSDLDAYYQQQLPFNATFIKCKNNKNTNNALETGEKKEISVNNQKRHKLITFNPKNLKISNYIISKNKNGIKFNKYKTYNQQNAVCLISSKGLNSGYHEWSIKILKCDIYRQEIGIISNHKINGLNMHKNGITDSVELGARAIYGTNNISNKIYYASYNDNGGKQRCFKNLSNNKSNIGWNKGDTIKICLDLNRWNVKFYLNDKKVRKAISVQPYKPYYPVISFIGNCQYQCINDN